MAMERWTVLGRVVARVGGVFVWVALVVQLLPQAFWGIIGIGVALVAMTVWMAFGPHPALGPTAPGRRSAILEACAYVALACLAVTYSYQVSSGAAAEQTLGSQPPIGVVVGSLTAGTALLVVAASIVSFAAAGGTARPKGAPAP